MPNGHVLVVDDEYLQRRYYCRLLEAEGYRAVPAANGTEAVAQFKRRPPLLALIDVVMPDIDGLTLYKALQASKGGGRVPLLLLTGLNVPRSVLEAASVGINCAHIFIKGSEDVRLLAEIAKHAVGPRESNPTSYNKKRRQPAPSERITIDPAKRRIWIDGEEVLNLAPRRYDLLSVLVAANGTISRDKILESVWAGNDNRNTVDVTIRRLRCDLKKFPNVRIITAHNGYRLSLDP